MPIANVTLPRLAICLASMFLWIAEAFSQEDVELERQKRHVVSRLHQLFHIGKRSCRGAAPTEFREFNDGVATLRARNRDFFRLFETSPYFLNPQGLYKEALETPVAPQDCGTALWLLRGLLDPEGQKVMGGYLELLRK